ncbi:MAG TPA: NAD-dependent epimerase/dehydratase family protein [Flavobacteriales bacterium]|nr:NAD-dependent epimerase/dehydratase family protein [Flavobacteriales bacterium]
MLTDPGNSTVLITGGAGFVGSSLALHWKARHPKSEVIALDNLKRRGSELNLPRLKAAGVRFIHGDVREPSDLSQIPHIDALVECAAEPSVLAGYGGDTSYVVNTNLMGTVNCLNLVARDRADIVFLSTSRVYPIASLNNICDEGPDGFRIAHPMIGATANGISEDLPLNGVRSLYGTTKLASELLIAEYAEMYGLRTAINRCGVIAGPWQMGKTDQGFVMLWISRHQWNMPLSYTGYGGRGSQVRDVLHVDDLCDLVALQLVDMDRVNQKTYNVGGGLANSSSLRGFSELAASVSGRSLAIQADPSERAGDLKLYVTDNTRITEDTGWMPTRDLPTVFTDAHRWLLANEARLHEILT